ncbi:hypothetical protein SAMN05446935_7518 [Burkholderia sp. YR290]|nr:hypothetical protein SAMN05446935_7518 [Burkholderia sp. YR290]
MKTRRTGSYAGLGIVVFALSGCNGIYLTGPSQPYEWQTAEAVSTASAVGAAQPASLSSTNSACANSLPHNWMASQRSLPSILCIDMVSLTQWENHYYSENTSDKEQQKDRDRWVQTLMRDIDVLWWGYKNSFLTNDDTTKVVSETLVTGMAAAAAGVTAQAGKTALAVLAATLNGFNTSFDKNVLANQLAPVLFAAIESDRSMIESQIIAGLKKNTTEYSLAMASRDVMRYADAGSLSNALASISRQTGLESAASKEKRDTAAVGAVPLAPVLSAKPGKAGAATITFVQPPSASNDVILGYSFTATPVPPTTGKAQTKDIENDQKYTVTFSSLPAGTYTFTGFAINSTGPGTKSAPTPPVKVP